MFVFGALSVLTSAASVGACINLARFRLGASPPRAGAVGHSTHMPLNNWRPPSMSAFEAERRPPLIGRRTLLRRQL
jgi:hypothetical protein